ncbi:MAG: hypothetical protein R3D69_14890 [Xanthobacteraceae bacterium]
MAVIEFVDRDEDAKGKDSPGADRWIWPRPDPPHPVGLRKGGCRAAFCFCRLIPAAVAE